MTKTQQTLLEEYKQRMKDAIDERDEEQGHINCDNVLCELLTELGFGEIVDIYDEQSKWYA